MYWFDFEVANDSKVKMMMMSSGISRIEYYVLANVF